MENDVEAVVERALKKIAKGGGALFISRLIITILGFFIVIFITRSLSKDDYGIYTIAFMIAGLVASIVSLGIPSGIPRLVAYWRGKKNYEKVYSIINVSFKIGTATSILGLLTVVVVSPFLTKYAFRIDDWEAFVLMAIYIPMNVILSLIGAIFQGLEIVKANVYFQSIIPKVIQFCGFLIGFFLILGIYYFIGCFLFAYGAALVLAYIYTQKNLKLHVKSKKDVSVFQEVLKFSLPLWSVGMLQIIINSMPVFLIGYFGVPGEVASFSVASKLADYVAVILYSITFLYYPILSYHYGRGDYHVIHEIFTSITKWLMFGTLPIFFVFWFFPNDVINLLFTSKYLDASSALQIITLAYILSISMGISGFTLIAFGRVKTISFVFLIGVIILISSGFLLIPKYGITGAAISILACRICMASMNITVLIKDYAIHPFKKHYVIPTVSSSFIVILIYHACWLFISNPWIIIMTMIISFVSVYGIVALLTKTITKIDKMLISAIIKKSRRIF